MQTDLLRKTVADFFEVDEAQVGPAFRLDGRGQGSIGRASLDAAIRRRVGLKNPAIYSAKTFGELIGESSPSAALEATPALNPPVVAAASSDAGQVACGVDIEMVANLPDTLDPWEDPFYRAHFSPGEIAYCLLQDEPKPHFAARWCAKEALKKCEPALLGVDFHEIEVAREASGSPYLMHQNRRLPHALSLSHTAESAVAMVIKAMASAPPPASVVLPIESPVMITEPPRRRGFATIAQFLLILVAVAASSLALYRTYRP